MQNIVHIIKENKWQTVFISCLVFIFITSVSYAAFYKSATGTVQSGNIGNLDVTYTDGETFNFINSMPLLEEEVLEYAPSYKFTVKNTGNVAAFAEISLSELVVDNTLKSDENFKWAIYEDQSKISEGNFKNVNTSLVLKSNILLPVSVLKTYTLRVWINDNGGNQNHLINKTITGKINVTVTDKVVATIFDCNETIETFTIPETGTYKIEAAGASGTVGNTYAFIGTPPIPGKGATISSIFSLNSGDELTIVTGCMGSVTQATVQDGTGGAGGGGSFVFKRISSITNSSYQIQKGSNYYEVLLVAAGGGGTNDPSELGYATNGPNGIGATWITPNTTAYSTYTTAGTTNNTSYPDDEVLGITQFISYNSAGAYYTNNDGICYGGFGGGECGNTWIVPGGGWSKSDSAATSFSSGTNTSGTTGTRNGNGYVKIYKD